jgi:predicted double-glycine peptidase
MFIDSIKMKRISKMVLLSVILFFLLISGASAEADIPISLQPGVRIYQKVSSWKEIRDKNVVKQRYDYSCGSGALATLINLEYGENVTEEEIIELTIRYKTKTEIDEIEKKGYSLLDLKKVAEIKGYTTSMYKLKLHHLYQLKGSVLIYYEPEGEKHFAVLKEVKGDRVYLADPAKGNIRMSIQRFQKEWPGIVLAIGKHGSRELLKQK